MTIAIIGAGGVGAYYGARLIDQGVNVTLVARKAHLHALQTKGLCLKHPTFSFDAPVNACDLEALCTQDPKAYDALIILTKATATKAIAQKLQSWCQEACPYILSLQNGVENEKILASYLPKDKIIGGLSVKIGAHVTAPGIVEAVGPAETVMGALEKNEHTTLFLTTFTSLLQQAGIPALVSDEIIKELWKKLIINNGVNALCALLQIKTGELMHDESLSRLVLGLMKETAKAAKVDGVLIDEEAITQMHTLITNFNSIKPSMFVDRECGRPLELNEICGVVIRYNETLGYDAPYTQTVATLLEYMYHPE